MEIEIYQSINLNLIINQRPQSIYLDQLSLYLGTSNGHLIIYSISFINSHSQSGKLDSEQSIQTKTSIQFKLIKTINQFNLNSISSSKSLNPSIDSINTIKEINSIITLISGDLFLNDLQTFELLSNTHQWTKSQATLMSLKTSILYQTHQGLLKDHQIKNQEEINSNSNSNLPVILNLVVVACKRKLILFNWKDAQWIKPKEIQLPHQVRSVIFSNSFEILIGYSTTEYATLQLEFHSNHQSLIQIIHQISDPFQLPSQTNPTPSRVNTNHSVGLVSGLFKTTGLSSLTLSGSSNKSFKNSILSLGLSTNEVIGIRDELVTFMNPNGKLSRISPNPSTITYPISPIETIVQSPYLISLLPSTSSTSNIGSSLMIHSIPTLNHIQTIQLSSTNQIKTNQNGSSPNQKGSVKNESNHQLLTVSSTQNGPVICISPILNQNDHQIQYNLEVFIMVSWSEQIQRYIEIGQYLESLSLIKHLEPSVLPNRESLIKKLNGLCALSEFKNHHYDQSIDEFIKLNINPIKIISLYHFKISGKFFKSKEDWETFFGGSRQKKLQSDLNVSSSNVSSLIDSTKIMDDHHSIKSIKSQDLHSLKAKASDLNIQNPNLEEIEDESDFKESIDVLIRYLTDRRQQVNKAFSNQNLLEDTLDSLKSIPLRSSEELFKLDDLPIYEFKEIEDLVQIAKIIDTALFKCYLVIKPTLLGPLCRLPNWCEVDEVESLLMDSKRYHELLDLYHGKKQHDRALKLLKKMGENEEDLEERIDPTIRYLQKLGPNHLQLIFDTTKWIFSIVKESLKTINQSSIEEEKEERLIKKSLKIFTEDLSTVESLPKEKIIKFLEFEDLKICRIYCEFLINELIINQNEIHEKLINLYIIEFKKLNELGFEDLSKTIYQRLLNHLIKSKSYSPNWVLGRLPLDEMFEARALTLGKIGQHDTALGIYINKLGNIKLAEEYCKRIYLENPEVIGEKIFLILLKIYLRPPPPLPIGIQSQSNQNETKEYPILSNEIRLNSSLKLLKESGHLIKSIEEVLNLLPNWINFNDYELSSFLFKSLNNLIKFKRQTRLEKNCLKNRNLNLKIIGFSIEQRKIKIDDKRLCVKCGKRIGNSVIAIHSPFGEVTHYQCRWEVEEN